MARAGDSVYFPPLDKCLDGSTQLLSWKTTFTGLSQPDATTTSSGLRRHMTDDQTVDKLCQFLTPYQPPTTETKALFDTQTSAINIAPTTDGRYNITQLRDDSLWLSKETGIDEVAALRVVILEWQSRPINQLLNESSGEEQLPDNVRTRFSLPPPSLGSRSVISVTSLDQGLEEIRSRRLRLLNLYLSERRYLSKTAEYLVLGTLCRPTVGKGKGREKATTEAPTGAMQLEDLGTSILVLWNLDGVRSTTGKNWYVEAIEALNVRVQNLERGSGWLQDEEPIPELEEAWSKSQILEMIHIMQTIALLADSSPKLMRADAAVAWFRFVGGYGFFEQFEMPYQSLNTAYTFPFQSLIALVSLAMFKIPIALLTLDESASLSLTSVEILDSAPYLLNPETILEMHAVLVEAAKHSSYNASLAVCAWGVLLQVLKEHAMSSLESRDLRQSERAVDSFDALQASEAEGTDDRPGQRGPSPHRRSSIGSDASQHGTYFEDICQRVGDTMGEDTVAFLGRSAVDQTHVFDIVASLALNFCTPFGSDHFGKPGSKFRLILLDLIRGALDWVGYQPELVEATLAVLNGSEKYWDILKRPGGQLDIGPVSVFINDDYLMTRIFSVALSRFPYEDVPFIRLCRALATDRQPSDPDAQHVQSILENIQSFTCLVPEDSYYLRDDGDFELTKSLNMLPGQRGPSRGLIGSTMGKELVRSGGRDYSNAFELPDGTIGQNMTDHKPVVVLWRYEYSGLRYFGRLLQSARDQRSLRESEIDDTMREVVPEIIGLLTAMLASITKEGRSNGSSFNKQDMARAILGEASDGLSRNEDIVSLVFAIFEQEIYNRHTQVGEENPTNVLVECVQFTHALLQVLPSRVWPFLGRSGLLGLDGTESRLAAIVASTEMPLGRYSFLYGCIRLFDALLEDSLSHALPRRRNGAIKTRFRRPDADTGGSGVTDVLMKKILLSLGRIIIDVYESNRNWRFVSLEEKLEMNSMICSLFDRILRYSFEMDDNPDVSEKIVSFLAPASSHLVGVFLSKSTSDVSIQPLLHLLFEGSVTPSSTLSAKSLGLWVSQTEKALRLGITLIRVSTYLGNNPTPMEKRLFEAPPLLAKVYAAHVNYRAPVIQLLDSVVRCAGTADSQPPSLLGQLGQNTAKFFLEVLSMLDTPLDDENLSIAIWRLCSAVVSNRQQWFAIYLLTGSTPRETLKNSGRAQNGNSRKARTLLQIAMDRLSAIEVFSSVVAVAQLELVALSADYWPWVIAEIQNHPALTSTLLTYLGHLDRSTIAGSTIRPHPDNIRSTSLILDIFAMCVHSGTQTGDNALAKKLLPNLSYLMQHAVAIPDYNASLHSNLRRNFGSKFAYCEPKSFKRTTLEPLLLRKDFYYDMELATKMLSYDPAWSGRGDQGFAQEFSRANANLSIVDAQVNLLHSWKSFAIQLSFALSTDVPFQKSLATVVGDCLKSNQGSTLPEAIFDKLSQSRADLAFALMQRVMESIRYSEEAKSILQIAWDTLRVHAPDIGMALTGADGEYTRTLMKILYLSLQAHTEGSKIGESDMTRTRRDGTKAGSPLPAVLEILGSVVAHGFRSLTTLLHDDSTQVLAADYALLNAVLRTCLRIPGIERHTEQLVTLFSDDNTVRYASTLLSWSNQLTVNNDPIFGDLTMMFLLELSSIPALAESIAVGGILTQISTAKIMEYFRRPGGIGPFDEPTTMYGIWCRGILPFALNLLSAIGAPIAIEVSAFLAQFRGQLIKASSIFDIKPTILPLTPGAGYITLSIATEAHSLALISSILDIFREAGASAGIVASDISDLEWDRVQVKDDLDNWLQRRKALRESIVPTNEREEAWARERPADAQSGADNRLEEKVVQEMKAALGRLGNNSDG